MAHKEHEEKRKRVERIRDEVGKKDNVASHQEEASRSRQLIVVDFEPVQLPTGTVIVGIVVTTFPTCVIRKICVGWLSPTALPPPQPSFRFHLIL